MDVHALQFRKQHLHGLFLVKARCVRVEMQRIILQTYGAEQKCKEP